MLKPITQPGYNDHLLLPLQDRLSLLGRNWGWFLSAGIASVVLGIVAFSWPVTSTVSMTLVLGTLFILSGIAHAIQSIRLRHETGNGWRVVQSFTSLAAGVLMLRFPTAGMLGVAIILAFYFFMNASSRFVIAMGLHGFSGRAWAFLTSFASFALGVYTLITLPISALWLPGVVLGIDFIVYGVSAIGFSFHVKKLRNTVRLHEEETHDARVA